MTIIEKYPDIDEYEPKDGAFAVSRKRLLTMDLDDESIPQTFRDQARRLQESVAAKKERSE